MSNLTNPIVMVVDGDPTSRATIEAILNANGFDVFTAGDLHSAVAVANRKPLDLVICELLLEPDDGPQIMRTIRKCPGRDDVPVVFTSAGQQFDVIRRVHDFGAAFHMRKPVAAKVLLELVDQALWMPHLIHNHLRQPSLVKGPHFPKVTTNTSTTSLTNTNEFF